MTANDRSVEAGPPGDAGASDGYLKFWTGLAVPRPPLRQPQAPGSPVAPGGGHFPIRCYFDNDSDELINFRGRDGCVDFGVYRELLASISTMGYNAINPFDQVGRAEFLQWESYRRRWNYRPDPERLGRLFDEIHRAGQLVEVQLDLGGPFTRLPDDRECWPRFGREWLAGWRHLLSETPIGKADIFAYRPRSPIWDLPYRCGCDECRRRGTGAIMTEVFARLEELVLEHRPDARLMCALYAQGRELWERGDFRPSERWTLVAADNGFGKLLLPEAAGRGPNQWGIYIHAGFWLNHTVLDPHTGALAESIRRAAAVGADRYLMVNGQSFKNFALNLELCMRAADQPETFDAGAFVRDWAARLFGAEAAADVAALVDRFAAANVAGAVGRGYLDPDDVDRGFVAFHRRVIHPLLGRLAGREPEKPIPDSARLSAHLEAWTAAEAEARRIAARLSGARRAAFDDQFGFPARLFLAAGALGVELDRLRGGRTASTDAAEAALDRLNSEAETGSKLRVFARWHSPENARPLYPIPPRGAVREAAAGGGATAKP
jgi:hypothetical protein